MNKWAVFTKVNGTWRFEGFVEEAELNREKIVCERDNGPGSYRAHLFVDDNESALKDRNFPGNLMRDVL